MADESRNALELDAVVRRFAESAEALAELRDQLQALKELRESEERANASLQEAAGNVSEFTVRASSILKGLEEAQATVAEVLQSGADILDGTELKGIAETTQANSQSMAGIHSRVDALDAKVAELIALVGTLQTTVEQGTNSLSDRMEGIHTDVKNPIIVKRLW